MATCVPFLTPSFFKPLANLTTSFCRSENVICRRSFSGSPSQKYATLPPCPFSSWRSTQLKQTFSFPPMNHSTYGGFHSSSCVHGSNQEFRSLPSLVEKSSSLGLVLSRSAVA